MDDYVYTISGAPLEDEKRNPFLVAWLPVENVPTDVERLAWRHHFQRHFQFPVVIAFLDSDQQWTLRGESRLLQLIQGRRIAGLPWQRIVVRTKERPPIPGDLDSPPDNA